jgi:ubiquitin carboxyl-terminal hydrolase 35/38
LLLTDLDPMPNGAAPSPAVSAIIPHIPTYVFNDFGKEFRAITTRFSKDTIILMLSRLLLWSLGEKVTDWVIGVFDFFSWLPHAYIRIVEEPKNIRGLIDQARKVETAIGAVRVLVKLLIPIDNPLLWSRTWNPYVPLFAQTIEFYSSNLDKTEYQDALILFSELCYAKLSQNKSSTNDEVQQVLRVALNTSGVVSPSKMQISRVISENSFTNPYQSQQQTPKHNSTSYVPLSSPQVSLTGKAGLTNLGATCYQNSILQALYVTDQYRKYLMSTDSDVSTTKALKIAFSKMEASSTTVQTQPFVSNLAAM